MTTAATNRIKVPYSSLLSLALSQGTTVRNRVKDTPASCVVWQVSKNRDDSSGCCARVHLQEQQGAVEREECVNDNKHKEYDGYVQRNSDNTTTTETTNTTTASPSAGDLPETVLQYERQLRKAQHAKKAGAAVTAADLRTVYVDEHLVVVNKPPGVLTVPGIHSRNSLLDLVYAKYYYDAAAAAAAAGRPEETTKSSSNGDDKEEEVYEEQKKRAASMVVHRLDMDTSGLVVFGRRPEVTAALHVAFREHRVVKEYCALVVGHWPAAGPLLDSVIIDLPLQRDHAHPPFQRVATAESELAAAAALRDLQQNGWKKLVRKRPKPSQTRVEVMDRGYATATAKDNDNNNSNNNNKPIASQQKLLPFTRLRLIPLTGRTHQLRVHCAATGFPIVGDPTYSLYGEAAATGGLAAVPVQVQGDAAAVAVPETQEDDGGKSSSNKEAPSSEDDGGVADAISATTTTIIQPPSVEILKAWTEDHPPNQKPMRLHAYKLQLEHPITGQWMTWEVALDF